MTDERIKQIVAECYWQTDVKCNVATTTSRRVTREVIAEAIKKALLEEKREQQRLA